MHKGNENFESKLDRWSSSGRKDYHQRLFPVNRGNESSWMSDSSQVSSPLQGYSIPCDKKPQETARDLLGPSFWKNSDSSLGQSSSLFSRDWTNSNDEPDPFDAESTESRPSPLKVLLESRPNVPDSSDYAVIKICNIQWDTTHQEIREFFEPHCIPRHHLAPYYMEGIHMILNRETGRTLYECFIEIPEKDTALDILQDKSRKRQALNGKLVRLEMSSQRELRMALFPRMTIEREKTGIQQGAVYLQRDEISFLLQQCRSMRYQSPRRSKANDRPYENIISVISKIPWHDEDGISTLFRDHVFEMLKLSVEALRNTNVKLYPGLLDRLIRAGLCVPLFTEKQKLILLNVAHTQCPKELIPYVYTPFTDDGESLQEQFAALGVQSDPSNSERAAVLELKQLLEKNETDSSALSKSLNNLTLKYEKLQREHDELDYEYRKLANDHQKLQYQYLSLEKAFNAKTAETCLFDTGVTTEKDFSESSFWFNPKESPTMNEMQQNQRF